jgi:tRNA-Thr(GGU) m(6)t(6)A37 methyltransferase TsaA
MASRSMPIIFVSFRSISEVVEACGRDAYRGHLALCFPIGPSKGLPEMVRENEIRKAEVAVEMPPTTDAGLVFIGRIHTPWTSRMETPRQGRADGPLCRIELFEPWVAALDSLAQFAQIEVLYWLHLSRRDLVMQSPANDGTSRGTFSLRSPSRPNPIGTASAKLVSIEGTTVMVRGLDCLNGTPLLDLKPDRGLFTPIAPPQPGDFQVGDP